MAEYKDILNALLDLVEGNKGIVIIKNTNEKHISYKEVVRKSYQIYKMIRNMGAMDGTQIVVQCADPEYFIYAFWACVMGGYIAVPIDIRNNQYRNDMNDSYFMKLDKPFMVSDLENLYNPIFEDRFINIGKIEFSSENIELKNIHTFSADADKTIYIQFSSGSTGEPKGVTINKSNIFADVKGIIDRLEMTPDDVILTWQPLTHCYGLIAFHVLPIILGTSTYIIPTEEFMKSPLLWLKKANQYRATRLGTIPFAIKHFNDIYRKSTKNFSWDLSCVKSILIGAEQVTAELCNEFIELMQQYSLNRYAMVPLYGLAECVTVSNLHSLQSPLINHRIICEDIEIGKKIKIINECSTAKQTAFLEIGAPVSTVMVKIIDDEDNILEDETIGHICIKGEIVTSGYYKDEKTNKQLFTEDGWLRTGDIGFQVKGNLTIVGRMKELVVINGKKYSCVDIEHYLESNVNKRDFGQIVACSGLDSRKNMEQSIIFVQYNNEYFNRSVRADFIELSNDIRRTLYDVFGISIDEVVLVENIPRTYSGKTRRVLLMRQYMQGEITGISDTTCSEEEANFSQSGDMKELEAMVQSVIVGIIDKLFGVWVDDMDAPFRDYGIISINIPHFINKINNRFNLNILPSTFFNYPNVRQLSKLLCNLIKIREDSEEKTSDIKNKIDNDDKIAIIGMSCRFPGGANSVKEFWDMLMAGRDGISDVPEKRWQLDKYYDDDDNAPGKMYCRKGGFLNVPIDEFDAKFFNISPKEAIALDPQQRLLLELVWEAFENAQLSINKYNGTNTGVFLGISTDEYAMAHLYSGELSRIDAYSLTGMCKSTACGRVSYTFGFEGPCIAVDTACSSTLSAMHLACNAIKAGETNLAVVAGVNLIISPATNIGFSKLKATSKDGHSKAFDESANGYGRGEGGGVLILKKLSEAVLDNDVILGVICGTHINQDGKSNGLTAPNGASQEKLIKKTLDIAGLKPTDIDYIEMHGTGTKLGDPIEVNAIMDTYCLGRSKENSLHIGSVKSNIGHLEAAAGIASVMKVLLSFRNDLIPADLHFNKPNSFINWAAAPINVVSEHLDWDRKDEHIRRAAINGFGFGGSNAHVIIEEYIPEKRVAYDETKGISYILKLSAKTETSLKKYIAAFCDYLKVAEDKELLDILYKANRRKTDFEYRFAVTGISRENIIEKMEGYLKGDEPLGVCSSIEENNYIKKERKAVFMFTGQGSQYINMGRYLYENLAVFRYNMNLCNTLFQPYILKSITELIYGSNATEEVIEKTIYAQPLIFAIEYSLAKAWESFGVVPEIVMGHSIGEYAAAVISGVMSLEDAVKLVSIRGRLMDAAPGSGSMGTIFVGEEVVRSLIEEYKDTVSIAAINASGTCVISGIKEHVEAILKEAEGQNIRIRRLKVSHGFHSVLMNPVLEDFDAIAKEINFKKPEIKFISALYARMLKENDKLDHHYWTKHIVEPVDFYHAVTSIGNPEEYVFIEVGANQVLSALCRLIFGGNVISVGTLNMKKSDAAMLAETVIKLYANGVDINWNGIDFKGVFKNSETELPVYPYDKSRYWVEPLYDRSGFADITQSNIHKLLGQKLESPAFGNGVVFQSRFTAMKPFFMSEHIIFDTAISPAAAHISMLLSTAYELKHSKSVTLKEIELRTPLAISGEDERNVQICIADNSVKDSAFSIVSHALTEGNNEKWLIHSQGKISVCDEYFDTEVEFDRDYLDSIPFDSDTDDILYKAMQDTGFELGESFRRITRNYNDNGQGVCFIEPLKTIPDLDMYQLYPGVIDSLLQTMLCTQYKNLKQKGIKISEKTIIPYFIGNITYNYKVSDRLWCYVSINSKDDNLFGEVTAFNENGEVIIAIKDFMAKFTTRDVLLRETLHTPSRLYYHEEWIQSEDIDLIKKHNNTDYVFIFDNSQKACQIIGELKKLGNRVISVIRADAFETLNHELYKVDSTDTDSWKQLFNNLDTTLDLCFVYYSDIPYEADSGRITDINDSNLLGIYKMVQALSASPIEKRSKVKILTNNVHDTENVNINDAAIWGFVKVMSIEYSKLYDGIVDINNNCSNDEIALEIVCSTVDEVSLPGNNKRMVRRLVKHTEFVHPSQADFGKIEIRPDASYLITGGTGALGMVYAESLINKGAKSILLMSRREPSDKVKIKMQELSVGGVRVEAVTGDVNDPTSIANAFIRINSDFSEVRGVIHAAGTLSDRLISDLQWEDFKKVLEPKVNGTIHVYNALNKDKIDFFIMVSSITSILGNMGQSNYAAANYFMNRFALWMQKNHVPGFSVCWGPWLEGGMASPENQAATDNMSNLGISKFISKTSSSLIEDFFDQPYDNLLVADVDWKKMNENFPGSGKKEFLSKITAAYRNPVDSKARTDNDKFIENLLALPKLERYEVLIVEIQRRCGKIMGFDNGILPDIDNPFREQGADSLMLFQIRSEINKLLNIELDISVLYNYSTLSKLVEYLLEDLNSAENEAAVTSVEGTDSEEDVNMLLERLELIIK